MRNRKKYRSLQEIKLAELTKLYEKRSKIIVLEDVKDELEELNRKICTLEREVLTEYSNQHRTVTHAQSLQGYVIDAIAIIIIF